MLKRYLLLLLVPMSITSCSSSPPVNSSISQPVVAPPISGNPVANNPNEVKPTLDVWSTEIEICKPPQGCYPIKVNTLGKPTEIGFLYYRDNDNGTRLTLTQAVQAPLPSMPPIDPKKGMFGNFNVRIVLKSNGIFTGTERPSTNPTFLPLNFSVGTGGDPKRFYQDFSNISYTIKSTTQLNAEEQAAVIIAVARKENEHLRIKKLGISDTSTAYEFQPKEMQDISSGAVVLKPQQVEPIVVGQKVGLKKW